MKILATTMALGMALSLATGAHAGEEYRLGSGDVIRITVFQNPDLTTEARVSESGEVSFPLVGTVKMGGKSVAAAEQAVANGLREGGFVLQPQVNILPLEIRGNQVSVLGQVNRPGRYPLETFNMRVADMLAVAGGVSETGADTLVLSGTRDGSPFQREITLAKLFASDAAGNDMVAGGDIIYVARAPVFFIYGQVQKPGAYRLEEGMTLMQALATGGGLTNRGTERGMQVHRRNGSGQVEITALGRNEPLRPDDVIYVKESLF